MEEFIFAKNPPLLLVETKNSPDFEFNFPHSIAIKTKIG